MKCCDCPHFHVLYEPIRGWDLGRVECRKHDLICDFASARKLNNMTCVEDEE